MYVAEQTAHRIARFSQSGVLIGSWGSEGSAPGQFRYPTAVAVAPNGTVYVVDRLNQRVQYFTSSGQFLGSWDVAYLLDTIYRDGLAVASDGSVWLTIASGVPRLEHYTASGALLATHSVCNGPGDGLVKLPQGIGFGLAGQPLIADTGNHRVLLLERDISWRWLPVIHRPPK